jgi:hypothetical protein
MKKSQIKPGDKEKPRRLTLNRETIQLLDHPGLSVVIGGMGDPVATSSMGTHDCIC